MSFSNAMRVEEDQELRAGWTMRIARAGQCTKPGELLHSGEWIDAVVPGTAAQALLNAGQWSLDDPKFLHDKDVLYQLILDIKAGSILKFEGLATIAEIWLDDRMAAASCSMFQPLTVTVEQGGLTRLFLVFRSLNNFLDAAKGRRARWRTSLVDHQALRFVRTSFLGHMPGWCPRVDIAGPYRRVSLQPPDVISRDAIELQAAFVNGSGILRVNISLPDKARLRESAMLQCAGRSVQFTRCENSLSAELIIPDIEPWWPHTHGEPRLYEVCISLEGETIEAGLIGFRSVDVDYGADNSRFGFVLNGEKIFARGACWTSPDIVSLACDAESYRRELLLMRGAGFNMVRIPGVTLYEARAFFEVADELGIMVWQDLQFGNFDYPFTDPKFLELVETEVAGFLRSTRSHCSLVAVCGGSEIAQQAAMMGMPQAIWKNEFLETEMKRFVYDRRADIVYAANSPYGGALPFSVNCGIAHYYGVGAYLRPLEDARRADVSFATECLAFANVPDAVSLRAQFPSPAVHDARWKERVPRDRGAAWDFENVREYYMKLLYNVDCDAMRRDDPERYLAFSRAAPAEVMEAVFAEWRQPRSRTDGALVFLWKDVWAGAGWGLVDFTGRPKSVWYALQRICRPVQIVLIDEGVNGLHVHAINETRGACDVMVSIDCISYAGVNAARGEKSLHLPESGSVSMSAADLFGAFFDANYAYKFGPPAHDVVVARLSDARTGDIISEAFHFPRGRGQEPYHAGLAVELINDGEGFALLISCAAFAQTIVIDECEFLPVENYFHLAPGTRKTVRLRHLQRSSGQPRGTVSALYCIDTAAY